MSSVASTQATSDNTSHINPLPHKANNLRIAVINCQGVRNKRAELENMCDYMDPDVLILTETKLDPSVNSSEFLPEHYKGDIRRDNKKGAGGVIIAYKDSLVAVQAEIPQVNAQTVWAKVESRSGKPTQIGAYYRPPSDRTPDTVDDLNTVMENLDPDCPTILGGDFNAGDIIWESNTVAPNSDRKPLCERLIEVLESHHLEQIQREPTREQAVLDLYCTNRPGLVKSNNTVPGISDHNIIIVDSSIRAQQPKKPKRTIKQWSKVDWEAVKEESSKFRDDFLSHHNERTVESNYEAFCQHVNDIITSHVPTKQSSSRHKVPWLTTRLRRMCRKKQRLYNRAKKSRKEHHWSTYKSHKKSTTKALNKARIDYINGILQASLDEGNPKPFWRYIFSQRNDRGGVAALKEDGKLHTGGQKKAEILNKQFTSVFSVDEPGSDTVLSGPSYPPIDRLLISVQGVEKLLTGINPNKAAGPDQVPCRILKELSTTLAPVLAAIFTQSLETGTLPSAWKTAFVSPIFKKGATCQAENYRPVSLTCVTCKMLEHIICHHVRSHLDRHGILSPLQHGFRSGHSCETQLLTTMYDLLSIRDSGSQTDVIVLDFSKAFDKVPHRRLLNKLRLYGVSGPILQWIDMFLSGRSQNVTVDGCFSSKTAVTSGVPQGTVLGPLLFLLFINDLPTVLDPSTRCRLFADDCLVYRVINSIDDQLQLQKDLTALEKWSHQWGMNFNAKKCNVMTISRRKPLDKFYQLNNTILDRVSSCTYLGVTISNTLSWSEQISTCAKKANSRLGFLRRNLKGCPQQLRRTGYISLVRSLTEYGAALWDPHLKKDINQLEVVQRRAARWIKNDYGWRSSVTDMLEQLGLESLESRRQDQRLILMYKVMHKLVGTSPEDLALEKADGRTRAAHKFKLKHQSPTTTEHRHSFVNRTIPEWNRLPTTMAEADSLSEFKSQLARRAD